MLSAISQFETELRCERQMDGIAKAKGRGVRTDGNYYYKRKLEDMHAEFLSPA